MGLFSRKSFSVLVFFITIYSCQSRTADQSLTENEQTDSIAAYTLPEIQPISNVEKIRIQQEASKWFDDYLANTVFSGSVLLAKNGEVVYEKYAGTTAPGNNEAITSHTPFHIASVTKTFTAMSVLKLVQEKHMGLDDELTKYFPGFNYPGVTVKTLLNHRSGLPNYLYFMEKIWPDRNIAVANTDVLNYLIQYKTQLPPAIKPDTRFSYCNTNYVLLALIIEKVTGLSYGAYLQKNIFKPLHMYDSFVYTAADSNSVVKSYVRRNQLEPLNYLDNVYGDKNIYSTTNDLLKWDRLLKTDKFLNEASKTAAYTPYSNEHPGIKNYGLGWRMLNFDNGKNIIFHNGWWHGNTSAFMRLFDEDVTIIVLNNVLSSSTYKAKMLANIFYPYYPVDEPEEGEAELKTDSLVDTIKKKESTQKTDRPI